MNAIVPQYIVEAVGWTLVHSLWQSLAVAVAAAFLVRMIGSCLARMNYGIYCLALMVCVCWSAVTFATKARGPGKVVPADFSVTPSAHQIPEETAGQIPQETPIRVSNAPNLLPAIVALWSLGVVGMALRGCLASLWVRRMRRDARTWDNTEWQTRFREWLTELSISKPIRLCLSSLSEVPAVIGHLKPIVLLPMSLISRLTPAQLEAVILHELMHIRRNDYLVNLLQIVCETLFFFNPATWWLSHAIRAEREHCCDEAAAALNGNKIEYAKALLRLEELRLGEASTFAPAANSGSLKSRINRLLGTDRAGGNVSGWSGAALILALVCGIAVALLPRVQAQSETKSVLQLRSVVPLETQGAETHSVQRVAIDGREYSQNIALDKPVLLDATHIDDVVLEEDPVSKRPQIRVKLTLAGTSRFAEITRAHVGKQIAIVVDGKVLSAPYVNEPITGGNFVISLDNPGGAKAIAAKLRPGAAFTSLEKNWIFNDPYSPSPRDDSEKYGIERALVDAENQYIYLDKMHEELKARERQGGRSALRKALPVALQDTILNALILKEYETQQRLAAMRTDFADEHPEVVAVKALVKEIDRQIDERIDLAMRGLEVKVSQGKALTERLRELAQGNATDFKLQRPSQVLEEARKLRAQRRYEEALDRHLWYHTASRHEAGQGGVRLSFALSDWLALGQAYPPAFQKLKEVRDQTGEAVKRADMSVDPYTLFHEYAAINETLREDAKTVELFRWLDTNDRSLAQAIYLAAQGTLLKAGEKELAAKYVNAAQFRSLHDSFLADRERPGGNAQRLAATQRYFSKRTTTLVALLMLRGKKDDAEHIAQTAREILNDSEFHRALDAALRGELPE